MRQNIFSRILATPCGDLIVQSTGQEIICCDWCAGRRRERIARRLHNAFPQALDMNCSDALIDRAAQELSEYFDGRRRTFDLPLRLIGTNFQRAVWQVLTTLEYGRLATYAEVAAAVGRPKAVRAVGTAVGENPCSILVPCHRVVGKHQTLAGYGGGLEAKLFLLRTEGFELMMSKAPLRAERLRRVVTLNDEKEHLPLVEKRK